MANMEISDVKVSPNQWPSLVRDLEKEEESSYILEPKGTWLHAGYHLTSATTGPQILSAPFALASLGWGPGILFLILGYVVSFYAYYIQSATIEHLAKQGKRLSRFADLTREVLGDKWSAYFVGPLQFVVCFATVVSCIILGGESLKAIISMYSDAENFMSLYQFTILFGGITLLLSQLPSFHSLRHLNLISLLVSILYCMLTVYGAINAGLSNRSPKMSYLIKGTPAQKLFGVFNALSILSNVYGNLVIVEIQGTISRPAFGRMVKGLSLCYLVILITLFPVAISGYWAFGSSCTGNVLSNIFSSTKKSYMPTWMFVITYGLIFIQLVASSMVYSQPIFSALEEKIEDIKKGPFSLRNIIPRLLSRSSFIILATLLATMIPFFSTLNAILGALGYTPLVFVIPLLFHTRLFKPTRRPLVYWINGSLISIFSLITILGCLAAFRQLIIEAKLYHLFANL